MENEQQYKSKNLVESKLKQNKQLNLVAALLFSWSNFPYEDVQVLSCLDNWGKEVSNMMIETPLAAHDPDCMGLPHSCKRCLIESYTVAAEKLLK